MPSHHDRPAATDKRAAAFADIFGRRATQTVPSPAPAGPGVRTDPVIHRTQSESHLQRSTARPGPGRPFPWQHAAPTALPVQNADQPRVISQPTLAGPVRPGAATESVSGLRISHQLSPPASPGLAAAPPYSSTGAAPRSVMPRPTSGRPGFARPNLDLGAMPSDAVHAKLTPAVRSMSVDTHHGPTITSDRAMRCMSTATEYATASSPVEANFSPLSRGKRPTRASMNFASSGTHTSHAAPTGRPSGRASMDSAAPLHSSGRPAVPAAYMMDQRDTSSLPPHVIAHTGLSRDRGTFFETPPTRSSAQTVAQTDAENPSRSSSPLHLGSQLSSARHSSSHAKVLAPRSSGLNTPVNAALLSEVAKALERLMIPSDRTKNELTYARAFDGQEAVDVLMSISQTTDRNLALLLGRALDAQKFFHDVTYDHRLRDSATELYQFHYDRLGPQVSGFMSGHTTPAVSRRNSSSSDVQRPAGRLSLSTVDLDSTLATSGPVDEEDAAHLTPSYPSGVFTPLTACYSPTCTHGQSCYSWSCPYTSRAPISSQVLPELEREESFEHATESTSQLWAESVSPEVYETVSREERKRQEVIFEIIATERSYVQDLEYLRDLWIKPLSMQHILSESRRDSFVEKVFLNLLDIHAVNARLAEVLARRQRHHAVVEYIGDIFVEFVREFEPYIRYGANQAEARLALEAEKASNPVFAAFVEDTERKAISRKLELNGYLTKPTTRLARYPLLFEQMLKYTADDNVDKVILPKVIQQIGELLSRVNAATGRTENRIQLTFLNKQLVFKPPDMVDLRLLDEDREMVFKGALKKRGLQSDSSDIQVYLFDHALLIVKIKIVHKAEVYRVYRRPVPLELLQVTVYEDTMTPRGVRTRSLLSRSSIGKHTYIGPNPAQPPPKQDAKSGYAITFTYLGRRGYSLTLWASTEAARSKWMEHVEAQQALLWDRTRIFDLAPISSTLLDRPGQRITCAVPMDFGRRIFIGREDGVYLVDTRDGHRSPALVLPLNGVTQVDVLEEFQILIVLADQCVYTFTLDALDTQDPAGSAKRGRRISSHTTFFRAGVCVGRTLVCVVKSSPVSSTIKTLEPIEYEARMKKQPTFRKRVQGGQDTLRVFKEFYIPTESSSIHFLKSKLCIGTTKGFEIVDLETLDTQGLLDPADQSLDFVQRRENLKAISIYRIDGDFLLCYNEFAFYVNKNGWRSKGQWMIHWEGSPTAFALHYPYVLAFEPTFIEVRHVETGALHQIITGYNIRCLFADTFLSTHPSRSHHARLGKGNRSSSAHGGAVAPAYAAAFTSSPLHGSPLGSPFAAAPAGQSTPVMSHAVPASVDSPSLSMSRGSVSMSSPSPYTLSFENASYSSPGTVPMVGASGASVLDSVLVSRGEILFVGDSSAYAIRPHCM